MSKIRDVDLFQAVRHATAERLEAGRAPTMPVFPYKLGLVRSVDRGRLANRFRQFDPQKVSANLKVYDALKDMSRFSGITPFQEVSHGGVYFSRHHAAMINEARHYSRGRRPVPKILARKGVISLEVVSFMLMLDLSAYSREADNFLADIGQDSDVQAAMGHNALAQEGLGLKQLMLHSTDYTVARAIGFAVAENLQLDGVQFGTARLSDRPGETGDNVVLYGPEGQVVSSKAAAKTVTLFDYNGKARTVTGEVHDVQPSGDTYVET